MGLSKKIRKYIFERDEGECNYCYCQVDPNNFHIDHVIPKAKGGKDNVENLVLSCPDCNMMKGARDEDEFIESTSYDPPNPYLEDPYLNGFYETFGYPEDEGARTDAEEENVD